MAMLKQRTAVNSAERVEEMLANPDRFSMFDHSAERKDGGKVRSDWRAGKSIDFKTCVMWLLQDEQLKHTAEEIQRLVSGMPKLLALVVPRSDLLVLDKYSALTYPREISVLGKGVQWENGAVRSMTLPEPFDRVIDLADVRCPISVAAPNMREKHPLLEAYTRQVEAVVAAVRNHDERLKNRAKNYMFGRPIVTAAQRVLANAMKVYPEFNWATDFLPYLDVRERNTKS